MSKLKTLNEKKAEGIVDRFLASNFVANIRLGGRTARRTLEILIPVALAFYIINTQDDRLIVALGVGFGLLGLLNVVLTSLKASRV